MKDITDKHDKWCKRIAQSRELSDLISHFRKHVCDHYDRHNREGKTSLNIWLAGVFNFMYILEKKCPDITREDMLFKLCTYYKRHTDGPDAPFDVDKFIEQYNGEIKKFHRYKTE